MYSCYSVLGSTIAGMESKSSGMRKATKQTLTILGSQINTL